MSGSLDSMRPRITLLLVAACTFAACTDAPPVPAPKDVVIPGDPSDPSDPSDADDDDDDDPPPVIEEPTCDPGNKRVHRLNRVEYDNTVRDLLIVDAQLAVDFPADDVGYGFDNIADVLAMSPLLVEKLDTAAETLASLSTAFEPHPVIRIEAETVGVGGAQQGTEWALLAADSVGATFNLDAGRYIFRVRAREEAAGPERAHIVLRLNGVDNDAFDLVTASHTYEMARDAVPGPITFSVAFTNDFFDPPADRNVLVDYLEVEGPLPAVETPSPARARLMVCTDATEGCARQIFTAFLPRAYRRPATDVEITAVVNVVTGALAESEPFDAAIALGVQAVLMSPSFLYRVEVDDFPTLDDRHFLAPYELASRLSYFVWSSMPDDTLFARAADGSLADPTVVVSELDRMLASPRASALVDALAGQWLQTRGLDSSHPDATRFPDMTDDVKAAMKQETALLLASFLHDDTLPITDIVDADYTFVNPLLANLYGLPFDASLADENGFARASLDGTTRAGLLTQGSFLTSTSYPLRTSPVKRGKWVLEQLLCMPPPPPPPNVVGQISEDENAASLRERLEQHRANPECAVCHVMMDPIGFSVEHFDPIGRFRETDNGFTIEDDDVFFTGDTFQGPRELAVLVKAQPELPRCVAEKLTTYATGRGFTFADAADACTIDDVAVRAAENGGSLADVIHAIVTSDAFVSRRGEGEP